MMNVIGFVSVPQCNISCIRMVPALFYALDRIPGNHLCENYAASVCSDGSCGPNDVQWTADVWEEPKKRDTQDSLMTLPFVVSDSNTLVSSSRCAKMVSLLSMSVFRILVKCL